LTVSLSAIIAAIWAGIWGFNWAATHLDTGAMFISILVGLIAGVILTYVLVKRAFDTVNAAEQLYYHTLEEVAKAGKDVTLVPLPVSVRVAYHPGMRTTAPPSPPISPGS
jgi:hypothetical protein